MCDFHPGAASGACTLVPFSFPSENWQWGLPGPSPAGPWDPWRSSWRLLGPVLAWELSRDVVGAGTCRRRGTCAAAECVATRGHTLAGAVAAVPPHALPRRHGPPAPFLPQPLAGPGARLRGSNQIISGRETAPVMSALSGPNREPSSQNAKLIGWSQSVRPWLSFLGLRTVVRA